PAKSTFFTVRSVKTYYLRNTTGENRLKLVLTMQKEIYIDPNDVVKRFDSTPRWLDKDEFYNYLQRTGKRTNRDTMH
ncbi:52 kDa repressor of the inhibitor of the protein kinase-like, partial [Aphis craccivora]